MSIKVKVLFHKMVQRRGGLSTSSGDHMTAELTFSLEVDGQPLLESGRPRMFEALLKLTAGAKYEADSLELVSVKPPLRGIPQNWSAFADLAAKYCLSNVGPEGALSVVGGEDVIMMNNAFIQTFAGEFEVDGFDTSASW